MEGTPSQGLTTLEAERLRARWGANVLAPPQKLGMARELVRLFVNPLSLVLIGAALVSMVVGDVVNALVVLAIVVVGALISFAQSYRSGKAVERLREGVAPTATVLRDGAWAELPRRELVPGDVVRLCAGDLVPADCRLVEARDLHVQEAALTGESLPVEKQPRGGNETTSDLFLGSSIVSGTGTATVRATGKATAYGDIIARLAEKAPETEFDRGAKRFGYLIMEVVFVLVIFVFLVNALMHRNLVESLLFSIALAVGLTPEFLPMIVSVTLARGAMRMSRRKVIVKSLASLQNFGSMDILCSDKTGTITVGKMALRGAVDPEGAPWETVREIAYVNSAFETGIKSPLDEAILQDPGPDTSSYRKIDEVPFDFERRRLSVVVEKGGERWLITKGAPESLLALCTGYETRDGARPLDAAARARCAATFDAASREGLRTIAVARRRVPSAPSYDKTAETDLSLLGFLTFADPPLPGAAGILKALRHDGVDVKILTGDSELVARHVCAEVGLDTSRVVLGTDLDRMSDGALAHVAEKTTIFARVSPAQKTRIVLALKGRGHVVGFLGDGVNDAPSLHTADVGISVSTAVDVAKDAAQIILLDRHLRALHDGILEGRKAFGNVMKYLLMGTSSNFGNMFSMAGASLFLPFLPMLPVQILLNNFLYDLAQVTIPTDNVDPSFIRKPKRWDISLIRRFMMGIGPISSLYDFLTFYALLKLFHASAPLFHTGWFVESLVTQTLVLFVIRTAKSPFRSRPSRPLVVSVLGVVVIGIVLPFTPAARVFQFTPVPLGFYGFLAVATGTYLLLVELLKRRIMPG